MPKAERGEAAEAKEPPEPRKRQEKILPLLFSERMRPCQHLYLRLLVSRTGKWLSSVFWSCPVFYLLLKEPQEISDDINGVLHISELTNCYVSCVCTLSYAIYLSNTVKLQWSDSYQHKLCSFSLVIQNIVLSAPLWWPRAHMILWNVCISVL